MKNVILGIVGLLMVIIISVSPSLIGMPGIDTEVVLVNKTILNEDTGKYEDVQKYEERYSNILLLVFTSIIYIIGIIMFAVMFAYYLSCALIETL